MDNYKWKGTTREQGVMLNGITTIPNNIKIKPWNDFLKWESEGNEPEPYLNDSELLEIERSLRYSEAQPEYIRRFELETGKTHKSVSWEHFQYARILNLKIDGTATVNQLRLLSIVDQLRDNLEALEDYIASESRTIEELEGVDVTDDSRWLVE